MTNEKLSPEKLAIAMTSEARRLQKDVGLGRMAMAERLAQWADDVLRLGEDQLRHRESHKQQWQECQDKLVKIKELCDSKMGSVYDEDTQFMAREVLDLIND